MSHYKKVENYDEIKKITFPKIVSTKKIEINEELAKKELKLFETTKRRFPAKTVGEFAFFQEEGMKDEAYLGYINSETGKQAILLESGYKKALERIIKIKANSRDPFADALPPEFTLKVLNANLQFFVKSTDSVIATQGADCWFVCSFVTKRYTIFKMMDIYKFTASLLNKFYLNPVINIGYTNDSDIDVLLNLNLDPYRQKAVKSLVGIQIAISDTNKTGASLKLYFRAIRLACTNGMTNRQEFSVTIVHLRNSTFEDQIAKLLSKITQFVENIQTGLDKSTKLLLPGFDTYMDQKELAEFFYNFLSRYLISTTDGANEVTDDHVKKIASNCANIFLRKYYHELGFTMAGFLNSINDNTTLKTYNKHLSEKLEDITGKAFLELSDEEFSQAHMLQLFS